MFVTFQIFKCRFPLQFGESNQFIPKTWRWSHYVHKQRSILWNHIGIRPRPRPSAEKSNSQGKCSDPFFVYFKFLFYSLRMSKFNFLDWIDKEKKTRAHTHQSDISLNWILALRAIKKSFQHFKWSTCASWACVCASCEMSALRKSSEYFQIAFFLFIFVISLWIIIAFFSFGKCCCYLNAVIVFYINDHK